MSEPIVEKKEPGPPTQDNGAVATPVEEKKKREYKDFGHEQEAATREPHLLIACRETNALTGFSPIQMRRSTWLRYVTLQRRPILLRLTYGRNYRSS